MTTRVRHRKIFLASLPGIAAGVLLALASGTAKPDDIDIFTGGGNNAPENPNVLVIIDNTSNWARQSQQWPERDASGQALQQGQSEVRAIATALGSVDSSINIGLMEFVTGGNANNTGGYVRQHIVPMTSANKTSFQAKLTTIFNDINGVLEKRNANTQWGDLFFDAYNYLRGGDHVIPTGGAANDVEPTRGDVTAYNPAFSHYVSPLSTSRSCAHTYIIFIANPNSSGPANDTLENTAYLAGLPVPTGVSPTTPELARPDVTTKYLTKLGYTSACYTSQASCSVSADYDNECRQAARGCFCDASDTITSLPGCINGLRYNVVGTSTSSSTQTLTPQSGTSSCAVSPCSSTSGTGGTTDPAGSGLTCPSNTDSGAGTNPRTKVTYTCGFACGTTASGFCSATPVVTTTTASGVLSTTKTVIADQPDSSSIPCSANTSNAGNPQGVLPDPNTPACPANTDTGASSDPRTEVSYVCGTATTTRPSDGTTGVQCGGSGGNRNWRIYVPVTKTTKVTNYSQHTYPVTESISKKTDTTSSTSLGNTFSCYASPAAAAGEISTTYSSQCSGITCAIDSSSGGTVGVCPSGVRYAVQSVPDLPEIVAVSPAHNTTPGASEEFNLDEWAKHLHTVGVPLTSPITGATQFQTVSTYTIDVYYQSPDPTTSSLLMNAANVSGGKYFAAHSEQQIVDALKQILTEIQAVNSAFASASLPVNATNRAQDRNQVFIGMFRPTKDATPRWYGNLKQYQLIQANGRIDLGDVNGVSAVSSTTGFVNDCASAYWSSDSGTYWQFSLTGPGVPANDPAKSGCKTSTTDPYSDKPDGPLVEKGAAAEVVRKGNNPPTTDTSPTFTVNRTLLTTQPTPSSGFDTSASMVTFDTTNTSLSSTLVDFISGHDTNDEDQDTNVTETRPSIHGDVVHSRPQPVDYGGTTGVVVYYGANDGLLHAVQASNGKELWSFIPPEFFGKFQRLSDNCPLILYPSRTAPPDCDSATQGNNLPPVSKNYFMDGSVGLYESLNVPPVTWIYPSMRRGGRMIYALDVSDVTPPLLPLMKWRFGCPHATDDANCTRHSGDITPSGGAPDVTGIGQTWSTPDVAFIKGYDPDPTTPTPVIILGGGHDPCEDANTATPSCSSGKGHGVYVLDAFTGNLLASFATERSVVADTALLDVNFDGKADFAYIADMGGNIYRINFVTNDNYYTQLVKTAWTITKVAHTNGFGRKFEFTPALVYSGTGTVYVAIGSGDREHPLICQYPFPTASAGTDTCASSVNFAGVTNRFYVFKDSLTGAFTPVDVNLDADASTTPSGTMVNRNGNPGCTTLGINSPDYRGWYKNLDVYGPGEQTVTSAIIAGGLVFFSTNRPIPPSAESCSNTLGDALGYKVNLLTGGGALNSGGVCGGSLAASFLGGGLPPSPVLATVPVGNQIKTVIIGAVQDDPGGGGGIQSEIGAQETKPNIKSKRRAVYWKKTPGGDTE